MSETVEPKAPVAARPSSTCKKIPWLGFIGLLLLFVAVRWNNIATPLVRDEGEYAYAAQILAHGLLPYEHSFLQKPPMIAYTYWLAHAVLPGVYWSARLLACLFTVGTTLLLGYVMREEFGPGPALPAMYLLTPLFLLPGLDQFIANTELFLVLPLMATVAVYVHGRSHGSTLAHWFVAGFLGFTTLCYKQTVLPLIAFVFVVWTIEDWRRSRSVAGLFKRWALGVAGGGIAGLLELGPFLLSDHGARLWECTVLFNRYYALYNMTWAGISTRFSEFWHVWWILFLAPLANLLKIRPRLWFWTGLFALSWITTSASYYGHYYLPIMPFWALLAALGLDTLASLIQPRLSRPVPGLMTAFTGIALLLVLVPDLPWMVLPPDQFPIRKLLGAYPFLESKLVAEKIDQYSAPGDYVFVAGSEPQILYYADRLSPTRFDILYPMMIVTPLADQFQQEAVRDLKAHPPKLIVLVRDSTSWLQNPNSPTEFVTYFKTLLSENYEMVGGYVRQDIGGHWQEPISEADAMSCKLVLYKRKMQ